MLAKSNQNSLCERSPNSAVFKKDPTSTAFQRNPEYFLRKKATILIGEKNAICEF